ncbi:MAG: phage tail protein [Candidatus Thorarchaeota archaeon]
MSTQPVFPANPHRIDPYKNYLFRVKMEVDGEWKTVLGVTKVSGLKRATEVISHRSGGENDKDHKTPGRTKYEPITLERGITHDPDFQDWAMRIHPLEDSSRDLVNYRRTLQLEILNERMKPVIRYRLYKCWVSEFNLPELDSSANALAIESIKIELEGWDRDADLVEEFEGG